MSDQSAMQVNSEWVRVCRSVMFSSYFTIPLVNSIFSSFYSSLFRHKGDTAQTIAHGIGFRFQTLKDIFYHHVLREEAEEDKTLYMPEMFSLTINFRTHNGILRLARSIVDLVLKIFPNSIDRMKSERSEFDGPRPLFLQVNAYMIHYFESFIS
jgi:hypothetical protein